MGTVKNVTSIVKLILIIVASVVVLGLAGNFAGLLDLPEMLGQKLKIDKTANVISGIKKISEFTTTCYFEEMVLSEKKYKFKDYPVYLALEDGSKKPAVKTIFDKNSLKDKVNAAKELFGSGKAQNGVPRDSTEIGRIVIIAKGTVRAGYDFSKIKEKDLNINGDTLFVRLPEVEIFDAIINPSGFETFDYTGSWSDEEEKAIKNKAVKQLREDAIKFGIIAKAQTAGKEKVCSFFKAFGFNQVMAE